MQVRVLFFGVLKDVAGRADQFLTLREGATVAELLSLVEQEFPAMRERVPTLACARNQEFATAASVLAHNDEVALLPPVSGGNTRVDYECRLVRVPIESAKIVAEMKHSSDGALVIFDGVVRDNTRGRRTLYLEYEGYEPMALKEMESLAERALEQFEIRAVAMVHRLGRLEIGETSVLIAVASAHRAPAYEASRWLIDTLKRTVPIWKKEFFEDGAVWAPGEPFPEVLSLGAEPAGQKPHPSE